VITIQVSLLPALSSTRMRALPECWRHQSKRKSLRINKLSVLTKQLFAFLPIKLGLIIKKIEYNQNAHCQKGEVLVMRRGRKLMKKYGGSGCIAPPFLTFALEGGEWSASHPGYFTPGNSCRYPLGKRLGGPQSQ
jgi:hypothetical protein